VSDCGGCCKLLHLTWSVKDSEFERSHFHHIPLTNALVHQGDPIGIGFGANNHASVNIFQVAVAANMVSMMMCVQDVVQTP
jgi:hypothetical protein